MAEYNRDTQTYNHFRDENSATVIVTDRYGHLSTGIEASSLSAFGEPIGVSINPVVQLDGLYGLDSRKFEIFQGVDLGLTGTATSTNTLMQVTSGTALGGYGVIRSRRAVRYRPGQGMLGRFTAKFTQVSTDILNVSGEGVVTVNAVEHLLDTGDYVTISGTTNFNGTFGPITFVDSDNFTFYDDGNALAETVGTVVGKDYAGRALGVTGYTQRAGFFTQEQALQVGFDNKKFGVLRQNGGKAHIQAIQVLTVDTGENLTVTLNDDAVVFASSATTPAEQAKEIYDALLADGTIAAKWILEWSEDTVTALSTSVGPLAGTFSVTSDASPGGTYTLTVAQTGVAHTTNWTYQEEFTLDKLDGTGPSGMTLDPTKLNIFQVNLRWLGAGRIQYAIEDPVGAMIPFHVETYANANSDVHLDNPSMKLGYVAASLGGTQKDVKVAGASMMGAIEGNINITNFPVAHARKRNLPDQNLNHIFTIKNKLIFNNKINLREVLVEKISHGMTETSFTFGTVHLFLNATNSVDHVWEEVGANSHVSYSNVDGTLNLANETPLASFIMGDNNVETIDLSKLRIVVPPNNTLTMAIKADTQSPDASAALIWVED
jgi:hypothetical protein